MKTYSGKIIDAHHHLWDLSLNKNSWLIDEVEETHLGDYSSIRRSYLVTDFLQDSKNFPIGKSVHLQAGWDRDDFLGESLWLAQLATQEDYPNAIVFYADLSSANVESALDQNAAIQNARGVRQILNWHKDSYSRGCSKNYLQIDAWRKNFNLLKKYDLSFDMQVYPEQVDDVYSLLRTSADEIPVVISHALMPMKRDVDYLAYWRTQLRRLSTLPNVCIKISGIAMFDHQWSLGSFKEIILPVVDVFSPLRCMVGSNFPVDKLYGTFDDIMSSYVDILSVYSDEEQADIFYRVAEKIYRI